MPINVTERAKNIIMIPKIEWGVVEGEPTSVVELYQEYILILAAIPAVAQFLGGFVFGYSMGPLGRLHSSFFGGLAHAIMQYLISLVMIYLVALLASYVAPNFGGVKDDLQALKLTAYAYTPSWIVGIFGLIPGLRFLAILGLWSLYLFFLGAPRLMRVPDDKAIAYTAVVVVATIVLALVLGAVLYMIIPGPGIGMI